MGELYALTCAIIWACAVILLKRSGETVSPFALNFYRVSVSSTLLLATLLIMGTSTVGVGLVPSAASIGMAAPAILLALRLAQGFAVGGIFGQSLLVVASKVSLATTAQQHVFPGQLDEPLL